MDVEIENLGKFTDEIRGELEKIEHLEQIIVEFSARLKEQLKDNGELTGALEIAIGN